MKRIIASAGLLALGMAGVNAAVTATAPAEKPWSVSAALRGFYDDNYALAHDNKQDSFGLEINPTVGVNLQGQQTDFGAKYSYTLRDYFDRVGDNVDHTHEFAMWLMHQFTERYSVNLRDDLVYSQEPTLTSGGTGTVRSEGTVLRNEGQINFNTQLSRLFGLVTGYRNVLYDYKNPTYSALLDRLEHYANVDVTWQLTPQTMTLVGYQFGVIEYTGGDLGAYKSKYKDSRSHYAYLGLQHDFTPQFTASIRAGVQFIEYYNLPSGSGFSENDCNPYVKASLRYNYLPGSYIDTGFEHMRTQTDLMRPDGESSVFYLTLSHSITPKLIGSVTGLAQYTCYDAQAGQAGVSDWLYQVGLNLEYRFTPNFSANVAYNFDTVQSDAPNRGYNRNRAFVGATVSY